MKLSWAYKGKIFDPRDYTLPNNCKEFAQSPQTLVFDDFVRIYFSTRELDKSNGKFLSHIAFVDYDLEAMKMLRVSKDPVVALGNLGTFDEHGIFPINPLQVEDRILAYTCGWSRRSSVSVETSTGLLESHDKGITFQRVGEGPVLTSSLKEPFLVGDSFVKKFDDTYHMWYIYGTKWITNEETNVAERVYKISDALSKDGFNWTKNGGRCIIEDVLGPNECQALPTVVKHKDLYLMAFCFRYENDFRNNPERGYRLGYAYSHDLKDWKRDDSNSGFTHSDDGWDNEMQAYPHLFKFKEKVYLLYNGNQFGRHGFGLLELESD